ncbi:MAG: hypothetical protein IKH39_00595, partial [Candidatus Methanomethylophilaceae archaeon]|nr:hypothetical protein [Candidatus Methanomethylophilaceae archaeon]
MLLRCLEARRLRLEKAGKREVPICEQDRNERTETGSAVSAVVLVDVAVPVQVQAGGGFQGHNKSVI